MSQLKSYAPIAIPAVALLLVVGLVTKRMTDFGKDISAVTSSRKSSRSR